MTANATAKVPLLLLKTRSAPADAYADFFAASDDARYAPAFVPVLEHRFKQDTLDQIRADILDRRFVTGQAGPAKYGALIFTSQRAVEAFAVIVEEVRNEGSQPVDELLPPSLPLYVVGPATARGLRAIGLTCLIVGEETGNGEALARCILEHYNRLYVGPGKPPLLFLVGDKRRDIIPKTLQADHLPAERRCQVDELVIYETGEMMSFKANFSSIWQKCSGAGKARQWVVVFSPTGCKAMLESMWLLDEHSGRLVDTGPANRPLVATIGPTTRDYLVSEFGFSPDVCAEAPTPEGIAKGITEFYQKSGW